MNDSVRSMLGSDIQPRSDYTTFKVNRSLFSSHLMTQCVVNPPFGHENSQSLTIISFSTLFSVADFISRHD